MREGPEEEKKVGERAGLSGGDSTCTGRLKSEFKLSNFGLSHPQPRLFVSSQWGYPRLYLGWRVFWAVYHVAWILFDWINTSLTSERPLTWPIYLTNWGYLMLSVVTVSLAVLQVYVTYTRKDFKEGEGAWYLKVAWLIYTIATNSAVLISVLYFALLFEGDWELTSVVTHLMTSVYVIVDLCVTAMPLRLLHFVYPFTFSAVYLAFNVVYWAAHGINEDGESYIYAPLDWSKPRKAAALAVGVLVAAVPLMHVFLWSLYMLKVLVWITITRGKGGGSRYEKNPV